jgi:hypothetical protein
MVLVDVLTSTIEKSGLPGFHPGVICFDREFR